MFESSNSIIFILLLLIFVYFIKKHYLVKKLEENYENLKQGHLILTPSSCDKKSDYILLERKLEENDNPLLRPTFVSKKKNPLLTEKKLTTSNVNKFCSNKERSKNDLPEKTLVKKEKRKKYSEACEKKKKRKYLDFLINKYIGFKNKIK